ncbi:hypothetical protein LCGC14_2055430 [marine sediment metagenome]|uniref:Uncharacterized protein n=1 Tax=marine sediment metagenome TaxID=412755 RepID=A0A0F9EMW1_9ZZZZ
MTTREIARRPSDMRCRAIEIGTKRDPVVQQCQEPITFVLSDGSMVSEDPGTRGEDDSLAYWSIFCVIHRTKRNVDRVADVRDEDGNRAYGPQRILEGQSADPWTESVEGGKRWSSRG